MSTGNKRYGDRWVFGPLNCATGAHQPFSDQVQLEACSSFTTDYAVTFSALGALDAPDTIPSGGIRAMDFSGANGSCMLVSHVWRERHAR